MHINSEKEKVLKTEKDISHSLRLHAHIHTSSWMCEKLQ